MDIEIKKKLYVCSKCHTDSLFIIKPEININTPIIESNYKQILYCKNCKQEFDNYDKIISCEELETDDVFRFMNALGKKHFKVINNNKETKKLYFNQDSRKTGSYSYIDQYVYKHNKF